MSLDPVMRALAGHWDSVEGHLTADAARRFRALIGRLTASGVTAGDQQEAAEELVDLLAFALPAGHPVRRAIADDVGSRSQPTVAPAEDDVLDELRRLLEMEAAWAAPAAEPLCAAAPAAGSPDEIMRDVVARLLAAPALSAAELRSKGGNPDQQHLISLDGPDGRQLPVFQFDAAGRPLRLVLDINALLDADADPWGVADWWLGRNAWLSRTPAESLGRVADEVLLEVARAIVVGD